MEFTSTATFEQLFELNSVASQNDRNNSETYDSQKVIDFLKNNKEDIQLILSDTYDAIHSIG